MTDNREIHRGVSLADPDSLLGMLQRGRGRGYLEALKAPPETVWPLLFECITNDPRLDRQCEYREQYYADLVLATRMDLEHLRLSLRRNDTESGDLQLVLQTLVSLAGDRGDCEALKVLIEYLSYGQAWEFVVWYLGHAPSLDIVADVAEALCCRAASDPKFQTEFGAYARESWMWYCGHDEEARTKVKLLLPICEPWKTICESNRRLATLFTDVGIDYDEPGPPRELPSDEYLAQLSFDDMFTKLNRSNCISFWRVLPEKVRSEHEDFLLQKLASGDDSCMILALRGLGALGTPRGFEAVKTYIRNSELANDRVRRYAFMAFEEMPGSLSLDTAREWFRREEWYLQFAAGNVLVRHATTEDIPLLTEALRTPETIRDEDSRLSRALMAFNRFEDIGPVAELEAAFRRVGGSYERSDAAWAMDATAPGHFAAEYAFECLWDCHWGTRALGCETVNLSTPGALERVRELAADPHEEEDVREAARERLEDF